MPIEVTDQMVEAVSWLTARGWRGNPDMSGDDRNKMPEGMRRRHDAKAREIVEALIPLIAAAEREECAKVADAVAARAAAVNTRCVEDALMEGAAEAAADEIAAAIRART